MEVIIHKEIEFNLIHRNLYTSLYFNKELQLAICTADEEYIPIDYFKAMFLAISDLIVQFPIQHLVFDKSKLRTFHQPSMEWYFAIWKPEIKAKGLVNHYKILPPLDWFIKSVAAGKHEIFHKYGSNIISGITITYVDSIEAAIEKIKADSQNTQE
jgi:hypothetical protein